MRLEVKIEPRGGFRYAFHAEAKGANLNGATNPVQVSLGIGDDAGLARSKPILIGTIQPLMICQIIGADRYASNEDGLRRVSLVSLQLAYEPKTIHAAQPMNKRPPRRLIN